MLGREDRGRSFVPGKICKICSELPHLSLDEIRSAASGEREYGDVLWRLATNLAVRSQQRVLC
jgi:hypothetical protein